jgi:hypothetical protein
MGCVTSVSAVDTLGPCSVDVSPSIMSPSSFDRGCFGREIPTLESSLESSLENSLDESNTTFDEHGAVPRSPLLTCRHNETSGHSIWMLMECPVCDEKHVHQTTLQCMGPFDVLWRAGHCVHGLSTSHQLYRQVHCQGPEVVALTQQGTEMFSATWKTCSHGRLTAHWTCVKTKQCLVTNPSPSKTHGSCIGKSSSSSTSSPVPSGH